MAKEFPIQSVSFRGDIDRFLTEGGGSSSLPKWVSDDAIRINSEKVYGQLTDISSIIGEEERALPILTEVTLNEKAIAKSHRPAVRKVFDVKQKRNVLGVTKLGKLLVKVDSFNDLKLIKNKFKIDGNVENKSKRLALSAIESVKKYEADVEGNIAIEDVLKVQLVDYQNNEYNHRSRTILEQFCYQTGIELEELHYACNIRLFSMRNVTREALATLSTMDSVLSVRKMPTIVFEAAPEDTNSNMEIMYPMNDVDYPLVGVLDSGIGDIDYLRPWIVGEDNYAGLLEEDINRRHGTAVASVINYGDMLENSDYTGCGPCKIQSCIVNTTRDRAEIYESQLVLFIQRAIAAHPEVKIWNLSQGTDVVISDNKYSDLAKALDSAQKENNILICKSAGNANGDIPNRITCGADSLLSVVVGSIAHKKTTNDDAEVNDRSPFSRIGPGVENTIKPDLVHYGGNKDTHMCLLSEFNQQFSCYSGTSFSTPRITALAANLQKEIGGECNPLLLKALLIHHASYPQGIDKPFDVLRKEMGFGLPSLIHDLLNNDADECTMVFSHTLEKSSDISSLDFPYPESIIDDDGYYNGEIILTLVVNPILNASQGCEYCQSQVDVKLETFSEVVHVDLNGNTIMRNEFRTSNDAVNVLNKALYCKKSFKSSPSERILIEQEYKYQPIKKYHVDLTKMTKKKREMALGRQKKWALKLNGLYRDAAEQSFFRDGEVLSQDVIVVVTIKDPMRRGTAYRDCLSLLQSRGYIHNDINIHANINVNNV